MRVCALLTTVDDLGAMTACKHNWLLLVALSTDQVANVASVAKVVKF